MFICSLDGNHLKMWNQSFQRLLGYDKLDLLHKNPLNSSLICKYTLKGTTSKLRVHHSNGSLIELLCHHDVFEEAKQEMCFCIVTESRVVDVSKNWFLEMNGIPKESKSLDSVLQMHTIV